jgi:phage-related protein
MSDPNINFGFTLTPDEVNKIASFIASSLPSTQTPLPEGIEVLPFDKIMEIDVEAMAMALGGLTDPLGQLMSWLSGMFDWLKNAVISGISALISGISAGIDWLKNTVSSILSGIANLASMFKAVVLDAIYNAINFVKNAASWISSVISNAASFLQNAISNAASAIGSVVSSIGSALSGIVSSVSSALTGLVNSVSNIVSSIGSSLRSIVSSIASSLSGIVTSISSSLAGMVSNIGNIVSNIASGLSNLLSSAGSAISNLLSSFSSAVQSGVQSFMGFIQSGMGAIKGLIDSVMTGIRSGLDAIMNALKPIVSAIVETGRSALSAITNILQSVGSAIGGVVQNIVNTVKAIPEYISNIVQMFAPLKDFVTAVVSGIAKIPDMIKGFIDMIRGSIDILSKFVSEQLPKLQEFFKDPFGSIKKVVSDIAGFIWDHLPDWAKNFLEEAPKTLTQLGQGFLNAANAFAMLFAPVQRIGDFINNLINTIKGIGDAIQSFLKDPWGTLTKALSDIGKWIWDHLPDFIKNALKMIGDALNALKEGVVNFLKDPWGNLLGALQAIGEWIWSKLPPQIQGALETLKKFAEGAYNFITDPWKGLQQLGEWIWSHLPEEIKGGINAIKDALNALKDAVAGFFKDPVGSIRSAFENMGKWIWDHLPDFMKEAWEKIKDVAQWFADFTKDPLGKLKEWALGVFLWIYDKLPEPLKKIIDGLKTFAMNVIEFFKDSYGYIKKGFGWIKDKVWEALNWIFDSIKAGLISLWDALAKGAEALASGFISIQTKLFTSLFSIGRAIATPIADAFASIFGTLVQSGSPSPVEEMIKMLVGTRERVTTINRVFFAAFISPMLWALPIRIAAGVPMSINQLLKKWKKEIEISLRPIGIGGSIKLHIAGSIKYWIGVLAKLMSEYPRLFTERWLEGCLLSLNFALINSYRFAVKQYFRTLNLGDVPLSRPDLRASLEATKRYLFSDEIVKNLEWMLEYLGYPDWQIKTFTTKVGKSSALDVALLEKFEKEAKQGYITLTDRFGNERIIPVSLMYELPSLTDVVRMMIRDMFMKADETAKKALPRFAKFALARGMHPDIAYMYYLYHFKYPPPERLWTFTVRGISGLLWFYPSKDDWENAKDEAFALGAYMPEIPFKLNFEHETLIRAFSAYMKWLDYARHSWIFGFTSDNYIMTDTVADIPTKIDQRWLVRWALYELISEKVKNFETPVREINIALLDNKAENEKITMDLSHFCRTLQATGLHPDWVPITAVAETINALADERTLMRTGFINLYERGFLDIPKLEDLLSGFFTASFKVAWFDIQNLKWEKDKWINVPVRFLPAERKFLELRSVMDRADLLLRELMSLVMSSIRAYVFAPTKSDFDQYMSIYGDVLSKMPERMKATLEQYRASQQTAETITKVVTKVQEYKPREISEIIYQFVDDLNNKFYKDAVKSITGKEMTLAVDKPWLELYKQIASYIREFETIDRARYYARYFLWRALGRFERGYISFDEMAQWVHDIIGTIRETPVAEVLLLQTSRVLLEGFIRETKANAILSRLMRRVITEKEALKQLLDLGLSEDVAKALVEAKARPYVPQPVTYGVMMDVVPEASEIVDRMLEVFAFPEWERKYWEIYFKRKPIADELTLLRTRIYNAFGLGATPERIIQVLDIKDKRDQLLSIYDANKELLQSYGITPDEFVMYYVIGKMEQFLDVLKGEEREHGAGYTPALSTLATLIEYVPETWSLVPEVLQIRNIPSKWANIWTKYYLARELRDDVNRLLSVFIRISELTQIPTETINQMNSMLSTIGYSQKELNVLNQTINLGSYVRAFTYVVPSVRGAVTDCLYIYDYKKIMDMIFEIRKLPSVWESYYLNLIRNRKAWRMVGRYITELITSYANGIIGDDFLNKELDSLKTFGLSDDEKTLIIKTAQLRFERLSARRVR